MPCNCDHLKATNKELFLSQIACLLDELDGRPIDKNHWDGYHPEVYNKSVNGDKLISKLCGKLQKVDVSKYSLEMQMWWRDHQEIDKARLKEEMKIKKTEEEKRKALSKLTDYERRLLGL